MDKSKKSVARLLNRDASPDKAAPDMGAQGEQIIIVRREDADTSDTGPDEMSGSHEEGEPTICRDGKLFKARLRNGRWESFGAPIGKC